MNEDEFLKQKANYAVVITADLKAIERLKYFLVDNEYKVIYQKTSLNKLIIQEEK